MSAAVPVKGRRLPDHNGIGAGPVLDRGDYLKVIYPAEMERFGHLAGTVTWWVCTPTGYAGSIGKHTVTEHGDGTITVSPSILFTLADHGCDWHGFLEAGVWRSC